MRSIILAGSQNAWLREQAPKYSFIRKAVSRFMPGEKVEDAIGAAQSLQQNGIGTVFTQLGENVSDQKEAEAVCEHYIGVLDKIARLDLPTEISVKPTQLGLDLDVELCYGYLKKIIGHADPASVVWIDMEDSNYVDATLAIYRRARAEFPNVGVCIQAYLYRTEKDLESLMTISPNIRLVKGAYREPPDRAFPRKQDVDENYFKLAKRLLGEEARSRGVRAAMATHDRDLIRRIEEFAVSSGISKEKLEFQMLYGIQRSEQQRLARAGYRSIVLISYGSYWYPWFMRRLAERPANIMFVVKNLFGD
jgi:proline dehydrogenase